MRTLQEAKYAFTAQKTTEDQKSAITVIEAQTEQLVEHVFNEVPETADRTAGLRKLLEAKQAFIQAITHPGPTATQTKGAA